jgi:hypothetical protein
MSVIAALASGLTAALRISGCASVGVPTTIQAVKHTLANDASRPAGQVSVRPPLPLSPQLHREQWRTR